MRVFVSEFVTGGGWYSCDGPAPPASLLAEGAAMLAAVAADLAAIAGVAVEVTQDARWGELCLSNCTVHAVRSAREESAVFEQLAAAADWSLVIAPEFDGHFSRRCRQVEQCNGRLLGPASTLAELTSDKHRTAEFLAAQGIPTPRGVALEPGQPLPTEFSWPGVIKPRDGAGSDGLRLINSFPAAEATNGNRPARLEEYCRGTPASVAFLCGPAGNVPLAPCLQRLSGEGRFRYLGGSLPIEAPLAARATRLASQAVRSLGELRGYFGVDLILGPCENGQDDRVIEINPRLTTSYVGLRALACGNLAQALLAVAAGQAVELCWQPLRLQFDASGIVHGTPRVAHEMARVGYRGSQPQGG